MWICVLVCILTVVCGFEHRAEAQSRAPAVPASKQVLRKSADRKTDGRMKLVRQGKELFVANQCLDCHRVGGQGCADGVVLDGIGLKRTKTFLEGQLEDPEQHVARHAKAFGGDPNLMTQPNLSKAEIEAVVAYLVSLPAAGAKAGTRSKYRK